MIVVDVRACLTEFRGQCFATFIVDVGHDDLAALLDETACDRAADDPGGTRDQRYLPLQSGHSFHHSRFNA
tara:strand:+ start:2890 stop:3102 length:213 start_codon:yes stop_codon:yes gene_type:complete